MEPGRPLLGRGCTTSPAPNGIETVCETFAGGDLTVSDFCGRFCSKFLLAGDVPSGTPGKIEDDDREELAGECNIGLVEFDDGGDDEPLDDVDEFSAVDMPPLPLPELEIDVA